MLSPRAQGGGSLDLGKFLATFFPCGQDKDSGIRQVDGDGTVRQLPERVD